MEISGERSRIRTAAASSILDRNTKLVLRQTKRGYALYANGDQSSIRCETWPQARRTLIQHGVLRQGIDQLTTHLTEGKGLAIRRDVYGADLRPLPWLQPALKLMGKSHLLPCSRLRSSSIDLRRRAAGPAARYPFAEVIVYPLQCSVWH